ncbi:MAG TPA: protein kinase, partial [Candidatus Acidoferrales bacterium]|nr:protein kinase [Candidatus Acidoferrales bacterium]
MALSPGTRLGPYEVTGALGAGGMGEVYRASDSRLGRQVAIKILPQGFASNAERMARFSREAQVLAALNHSSIAHVYGLEESDGTRALVMELVEGPTLAERIAQGPLPLDEALRIAKQIAEALEYAHERGIIHRDLKPANVKVTPEGNVKILDFGLAKALDESPAAANINTSPTISMAATHAGLILGTAAYMSPEQARGKTVDRRTDIWAFGAVSYEMLSRKQAFEGEDTSQVMAAVIMKEPDWTQLPAEVPSAIRGLVQRCLTKDPVQRLQAIGEARITLDRALSGSTEEGAVTALPPMPVWRRALPWALVAVLILLVGALSFAFWERWGSATTARQLMRLSVELGAADASLYAGPGSALAISPDGTVLAFTARSGPQWSLYLRRLDQSDATVVAGSEGARDPFFSPDGQWVAFFTADKLKKVSVAGGAAMTLCDAPGSRGGAWAEDDNIVFAPTSSGGGLMQISAAGGTPSELTKLDEKAGETSHRWPQVLSHSSAVIFTSNMSGRNFQDADVAAVSLKTGQRKIVQHGGMFAHFLPAAAGRGAYLLYVHENTIFAAPFDAERLEITGTPIPVVEGVSTTSATGSAEYALSPSGTLVYVPGRDLGAGQYIVWIDKDGKAEIARKEPGYYANIRVSPDGKRMAMEMNSSGSVDIWVYEPQRDIMSRITFGTGESSYPVWTPDAQRITFSSNRDTKSASNLYWQRADGTGDAERLTESKFQQNPLSWHPSGKFLAFSEQRPQTGFDILILPMEGTESSGWKRGKPFDFVVEPGNQSEAAFSPDGHWLAYTSNESGRAEVYVRPFPGPGGKWQVSTDGGRFPTWSRKSNELFYEEAGENGRIMSVKYGATGTFFQPEKPDEWTSATVGGATGPYRRYDVMPDGQRLAALKTTILS